ncbi:MAG: transglycosylase SLT domain-containing protein [Nitrospinae bacterium]|nr:transglycosylase SLT domain-containing protein [Nitrospinota bacterium]
MAHPGLTEFHNVNGGVRWRLTEEGMFIDGSGIERTQGQPVTVTNVWERYHEAINEWAAHFNVSCELILATICTESRGKPAVLRPEPGFVSDAQTPDRVSVGLMQTLISTARETLRNPAIDRAWLLIPGHSIQAGTSYINQQRGITQLDPPKVACAYNAGGLHHNNNPTNRWRMRQFPIGTAEHCDRFVKWFNDAVAMLKTHPIRPVLSLETFLRGA